VLLLFSRSVFLGLIGDRFYRLLSAVILFGQPAPWQPCKLKRLCFVYFAWFVVISLDLAISQGMNVLAVTERLQGRCCRD
jgi:hypothetical protein